MSQWAEDGAEVLLGLAEGDCPCSGKEDAEAEQTHKGHTACPGLPLFSGPRSLSGESQRLYYATKPCMRSTLRGYSILKTP